MPLRYTLPFTLAATLVCAMPTLNAAHANDTVKHRPPLRHRHVVASAPQPSPWSSWWSWSSGSSSSESADDSIRRDDEMRRNDEFNRMMQSNSDAVNAAIQQSNDMNAAAQLQIQIDQNIANMPVPQPN
jgi:hypothetical protein